MGLFEDAQREKAARDATQRRAALEATAAANNAESMREVNRRLLQQFVAEMTRLGVAPAKHRSTRFGGGMGGYYYRDKPKRNSVTGWSVEGCRGCNGGPSGCRGSVVGPDGLMYVPAMQPGGLFKAPLPAEPPEGSLETLLSTALSHYL